MTEFVSKTPQLSDNVIIKTVANRIKLATGIDVLKDKIPFRVDFVNGKFVGFNIKRDLDLTEESNILIEFPELKLK